MARFAMLTDNTPFSDLMATYSPKSLIAKGKELDLLVQGMGFKRRKYFWIFKESDRHLRERVVKWLKWLPR